MSKTKNEEPKKAKGKVQTYFQEKWLSEQEFAEWSYRYPPDARLFSCRICKGGKPMELSNMGRGALTSHQKGESHKNALKARNLKSRFFFSKKKKEVQMDLRHLQLMLLLPRLLLPLPLEILQTVLQKSKK